MQEVVSWIANIASVVSLGVSLYVAWQVRAIKDRFVKRFAITAFRDKLRAHNKKLSAHIGTAADNVELMAELAKYEANLQSAIPHLEGVMEREAKTVLYLVAVRPPDVRTIYTKTVGLLQGLENAAAEQEVKAHVG